MCFLILNTGGEILPVCQFNCSCGITYVAVNFFLYAVGCVYLFSTTYLTDVSFPWCTANSEALLLASDIGFAVKGPSVSRILTLLSKTVVFDP